MHSNPLTANARTGAALELARALSVIQLHRNDVDGEDEGESVRNHHRPIP